MAISELIGKRALVTGASRGIGAAIALALTEKGADVALTYAGSAARAAEDVKAIEAKGRQAVAIQADSRDQAAIPHLTEGGRIISIGSAGADRSWENGALLLHDQIRAAILQPRPCSRTWPPRHHRESCPTRIDQY